MSTYPSFQFRFTTPKRLAGFLELFDPQPVKVPGADPSKKLYQAEWFIDDSDPDLKKLLGEATQIRAAVAKDNGQDPDKAPNWPFTTGAAYNARAKANRLKKGLEYNPDWDKLAAGKTILSSRSYAPNAPHLYYPENGKFIHAADPNLRASMSYMFYRGVRALGLVSLVGNYTSAKSWGVSCFINEVASLNDGARIGGNKASDASVWGGVPVTEEAF